MFVLILQKRSPRQSIRGVVAGPTAFACKHEMFIANSRETTHGRAYLLVATNTPSQSSGGGESMN